MNFLLVAWSLLICILLMMELSNPGFFLFLGASMGSLAAMCATIAGYSITIQLLLFLMISIVITLILLSVIGNQKKHAKTNVELLIGKKALVTNAIHPYKTGQVDIDGQIWSAKSYHNQLIEVGNLVIIVNIVGVHVLVEKIGQKEKHD